MHAGPIILAATLLAGSLYGQTAGPAAPKKDRSPSAVPAAAVPADRWFGRDKAKHVTASMLICGTAGWLIHNRCGRRTPDSRLGGAVFSISLGVLKELMDDRSVNNHFSWRDIAADLLGVIFGGLLLVW